MKRKGSKWLTWILAIIVAGAVLYLGITALIAEGEYDQFAQCLEESGTKFYGTYWCPFCANQKARFGASKSEIPYVECSNPDRTTKEVCQEQNVGVEGGTGFPTWIFADGTRLAGDTPLEVLAERSGCPLLTDEEHEAGMTPDESETMTDDEEVPASDNQEEVMEESSDDTQAEN